MNDEAARRRRPRWGVRAMAWLTGAFISVVASNTLHSAGNSDWVVVTFIGTIAGLSGAAYCSLRGLSSAGWLGR